MRIKIVDVDINNIGWIEELDCYDAVEILFRAGSDPLGRARLTCSGGAIEAEEIRPLTKDLPIPAPLDIQDQNLPTVTVAICTMNRPDLLAIALDSLARQENPPDEILVIDNGCQDEVRELTEQILPQARYLVEPRPGLDFARNRALSAATGDVIAFLDDDAAADPFWVHSLAESFAAFPQAGAVTGLILPLKLETEAQAMFEAYGGFARGFKRRVLPRDGQRRLGRRLPLIVEAIGVGSGCNMAFRSAVLGELCGFDEALDTGPPLPGGGDLDIFYRVLRAGYELVYEPRAMIRHYHRPSKRDLRRQLAGHHRSLSAFLMKTIGTELGFMRLQAMLFLFWRLAKNGYRFIGSLLGLGALPLAIRLHILWSGIVGLGSYHVSSRQIRDRTTRFGGRPPFISGQLLEFWRFRELVWNLTVRDLKVKYQRSWLGFLWTLLNPLVTIGVLVAVFSYIVKLPIENYWAFLISGYFAWNFFSQTLNGGVQAAVGNAYLSRAAYFPQEVLVVSAALARLLEFLGELLIVIILLAIFHHKGVPLSFIMVLPLVVVLFLLVIGISLPIGTMGVYYYDTVQAIPLATLALFYASPVFYNIGLVPESIRVVYLLNPIAMMLSLYHTVLYEGMMPDPVVFFSMVCIAGGLALLSYMWFNRKKREFAEIV